MNGDPRSPRDGQGPRWFGLYPALVSDLVDPDAKGRIKVKIPAFLSLIHIWSMPLALAVAASSRAARPPPRPCSAGRNWPAAMRNWPRERRPGVSMTENVTTRSRKPCP